MTARLRVMPLFWVKVYKWPWHMEVNALQKLLKKFREGKCTEAEMAFVLEWYRQLDAGNTQDLPQEILRDLESYTEEQRRIFRERVEEYQLKTSKKARIFSLPNLWKAAAVVGGIILLVFVGRYALYQKESHGSYTKTETVAQGAVYNGWVRLPDGSTIVLKPGSSLDYDSSRFGQETREVTLTGDAFFDVAHNAAKPFIVHAGKVKVTVLGTAFSIAAVKDMDKVTVVVTRGRVKVEDEKAHRVLAVLTPGKSVAYNPQTAALPPTRDTILAMATQWVAADLQFESLPFAEVADRLGRRYQTTIQFANPAIRDEVVTLTAPFEGTETIEQVLDILCSTFNCTYTKTAAGFTIGRRDE